MTNVYPIASAALQADITKTGGEIARTLRALVERQTIKPISCDRIMSLEVARCAVMSLFSAQEPEPWVNRVGLTYGIGLAFGEVLAQMPPALQDKLVEALEVAINEGQRRATAAFSPQGRA